MREMNILINCQIYTHIYFKIIAPAVAGNAAVMFQNVHEADNSVFDEPYPLSDTPPQNPCNSYAEISFRLRPSTASTQNTRFKYPSSVRPKLDDGDRDYSSQFAGCSYAAFRTSPTAHGSCQFTEDFCELQGDVNAPTLNPPPRKRPLRRQLARTQPTILEPCSSDQAWEITESASCSTTFARLLPPTSSPSVQIFRAQPPVASSSMSMIVPTADFSLRTATLNDSLEMNNRSSNLAVKSDAEESYNGNVDFYPQCASANKRRPENDVVDEDRGLCPICMEPWTSTGRHRLASLRCGHLFGHCCIAQWLQFAKVCRCPVCNKHATVSHVTVLYAEKLFDTAHRDKLKKELDNVRLVNKQLEVKMAQMKYDSIVQIAELKRRYPLSVATEGLQYNEKFHLVMKNSVHVSGNGGCSVLEYNRQNNLLVVGSRSPLRVFGIKYLDTSNFRTTQFVYLHQEQIRLLTFHPRICNLLLSVSLDGTAKLLDVRNNAIVGIFTGECPLLSGCWDSVDGNAFFVGGLNGVISQFDMRKSNGPIYRLSVFGETSPVTSLAAFAPKEGRMLSRGGFFACKARSCWAYEQTFSGFSRHQLSFVGPFNCLRYDDEMDQLLVSAQPITHVPNSRYIVSQLAPAGSSYVCLPVCTLEGSTAAKLQARPCSLAAQGQALVATDGGQLVELWSVASGRRVGNISIPDVVVDLCPIYVEGVQCLAVLTEKALSVYNITST